LGGKSLVAAALQEKKLNSLNSFGLVLVGIGSKNMFFYVLLYSSLNLKNQEISTAVRLDTVKVLNTIILVFVCGGGGCNFWEWKQDVLEMLEFDSTVLYLLSQEDFIIVLGTAFSPHMFVFLLLQEQYNPNH